MHPVIEPSNTELQIIDIKKMQIAVIDGEIRPFGWVPSVRWREEWKIFHFKLWHHQQCYAHRVLKLNVWKARVAKKRRVDSK